MHTKKKGYLVTGAAGFVGSCLVRRLVAERKSVHIIVKKNSSLWRIRDILPRVSVHCVDLSKPSEVSKSMELIRPDIIYHLATYGAYPSQDDIGQCIKTNIEGTWNLLKATLHLDYELLVNTGSSSEYGSKNSPMKESDSLAPCSNYAVTKCAQTLLCSHVAKEHKKPIVTLRPFSVYGPYEDKNRFIPTLLKNLYFRRVMNLVAPDITRDWLYVDDMVSAYFLLPALKKYPGEVFNVGTGTQATIREVTESAIKVAGVSTRLRWCGMKNRKWDTTCWVADISKTKKLLKWKARVDLDQGLRYTWKWFLKNG